MNTLLIFVLCLLCIYSVASSSHETSYPSSQPTDIPSEQPSSEPTMEPTLPPTDEPTPNPSPGPTPEPTPGPTPVPTPGPTTETAVKVEMTQSFAATDASDFQQFLPPSAPAINTAALKTDEPNEITISDSFAAILIKIVTDALQIDTSAMRVTAVYLVFVPARRMLSEDMENHRLLQAGTWEMRVEYEVIVDTMAAADQAAAAIPSGDTMKAQIETAAAADGITIDMSNITPEPVVTETIDGIPIGNKEKKDPFNKVAFGSSFPFAVIIFFSVLYLMYSPWMKTGYVSIESNVFFWKSTQRRYVEIKRGVLYAYGQGESHHEISLGEVELITTETDQSLQPFTLQLNKVEPAGDAAYMQVTVGDSVKQSVGSTLLRIQCASEPDFQNWIASINAHIDYARSPYRQWSNYYIVNPFVSTACVCFTNSPSNSSDQELSTNRTNGKI